MKKIKLLHLADLHLDARFPSLGDHGHSRREELRKALRQAVDVANTQRVDLVLICGDLFEEEGVSHDTLEFIKDQFLQLFHIPIFLAPGNRDPWWQGSPYCATSWPKNVHIFSESRLRSVDIPLLGVAIHGIACTPEEEQSGALKDFRVARHDLLNIVMMHGSEISSLPREKKSAYPFTLEELEATGASYTALGHYHDLTQFPADAPDDNFSACYPGSPVGLSFDESGPRGLLCVEVGSERNMVRFIPVEQREMVREVVTLPEIISRDQVVKALRKIAEEHDWKRDYVKVVIQGEVYPEVELNLNDIADSVTAEFHHIQLEDGTSSFYDVERLQKDKSIVGEFVRAMMERIAGADGDPSRKKILEKALTYGLDAFFLPKVSIR